VLARIKEETESFADSSHHHSKPLASVSGDSRENENEKWNMANGK